MYSVLVELEHAGLSGSALEGSHGSDHARLEGLRLFLWLCCTENNRTN